MNPIQFGSDAIMTLDEFKKEMLAYRKAADKEAISRKESNLAWQSLHDMYQNFNAKERAMADQVLEEWVSSDDENVRYDALVLIGDFKIVSVVPALRALASRLASSTTPDAPYELNKINRIIESFPAM